MGCGCLKKKFKPKKKEKKTLPKFKNNMFEKVSPTQSYIGQMMKKYDGVVSV